MQNPETCILLISMKIDRQKKYKCRNREKGAPFSPSIEGEGQIISRIIHTITVAPIPKSPVLLSVWMNESADNSNPLFHHRSMSGLKEALFDYSSTQITQSHFPDPSTSQDIFNIEYIDILTNINYFGTKECNEAPNFETRSPRKGQM